MKGFWTSFGLSFMIEQGWRGERRQEESSISTSIFRARISVLPDPELWMKCTAVLCGESYLLPPWLGDSPSTRPVLRPILNFHGPSFVSRRIEFLEIALPGRLSFWPPHLWIYFVLSCPSCAILSLKFFRLWAPELFGSFLA